MKKWGVFFLGLFLIGCGDCEGPVGGWFFTSNGPGGGASSARIVTGQAAFVDISGSGQGLNLGDDEVASLPLPFALKVGTQTFQSVNVCSNGFLHFGTPNPTFANTPLPDPLAPDPLLSVFWDDLSGPGGNWIFSEVQGTTPNRRFIVMWRNAQSAFATGNGITFEAILNESGSVELQYQDTDFQDPAFNNGASATAGFQVGGQGQLWCFNGAPNPLPGNSALLVQGL